MPRQANMRFFSWLFPAGSGQERQQAQTLGITVADVERELPYFSRHNHLEEVSRSFCVRYAVPRRGLEPRTMWTFLQRTKTEGAQFPNGYLLVADSELASGLHERLHEVAEEYGEEFFEFEGTGKDVAVYWLEWGGTKQVEKLNRLLRALAAY